MWNPFETGRGIRAERREAFDEVASAQSEIIMAGCPAGRARALREFAEAARRYGAAAPGRVPKPREWQWLVAAQLAETAAYSEQWLDEGRLEGTLPGRARDFGTCAQLGAWVQLFTVTSTGDRRRACLDLAREVGRHTNTATVSVLFVLARAYLAEMPYREDDGASVTVAAETAVAG
jgi:hypothetical protein